MTEEDNQEFTELLLAAFDIIGKTPAAKVVSPTAQALFFTALQRFPLDQVRYAIGHHIEVGKFTPTPADLISYIEEAGDNRPGAEEAWALALATLDDTKTVVWTYEAAEAFGKAQPVLEQSGAITARKTFIEIYDRLVAGNRRQHQPPTWFASPGTDQAQRQLAMKAAVHAGLLSAPARPTLQLEHSPGSIPQSVPSLNPTEQLAEIRRLLTDGIAEKQRQADAAIDGRIEDEDQFKRDLARRVRERERYIAMADQAQVQRNESQIQQQAGNV